MRKKAPKQASSWLMKKSPAKVREEQVQALKLAAERSRAAADAAETARLTEQWRADGMQDVAQRWSDLFERERTAGLEGLARVDGDVRSVGRKVDSFREEMSEFLLWLQQVRESGALGAGASREELMEALAAVQSVSLVGQDVRLVEKRLAELAELVDAMRGFPGPGAPGGGAAGVDVLRLSEQVSGMHEYLSALAAEERPPGRHRSGGTVPGDQPQQAEPGPGAWEGSGPGPAAEARGGQPPAGLPDGACGPGDDDYDDYERRLGL